MSLNAEVSVSKRAFTIGDAAVYACVSYATVRNWIADGALKYEELPTRGGSGKRFIRIRRTDLDELLNQHCRVIA